MPEAPSDRSFKPISIPDRPAGIRPSIAALPASKIAEVALPVFGDPDIVPLWFGEGDMPTPAFICEAAAEAMRKGHTFYTYKNGIPELRGAVARYLSGLHARPVTSERVIVTSSGMAAIMLVAQTLIDPGDNVAVVSPVWPNIHAAIGIMGGTTTPVGLTPTTDGGWRFEPERLFAACDARTRAIFVNSPSNPTGWMLSAEHAAAILAFARRRGLWVLADEVYGRMVYDRRVAPSFLDIIEAEDRVVVLNSFSKSWAMTGWRLGWMVAPPEIQAVIAKMIEFNTSGSPTFLQHAAVTAIEQGEPLVSEIVQRCRTGRDILIQGLNRFPRIRVKAPEGAFYAFCRVEGVRDSFALAREIVAKAKVGVAPGIAFGEAGEGYLRLCFAASAEKLGDALERLAPILG